MRNQARREDSSDLKEYRPSASLQTHGEDRVGVMSYPKDLEAQKWAFFIS